MTPVRLCAVLDAYVSSQFGKPLWLCACDLASGGRDPSTRAIMRVWIDPADLSRHYVPEPSAAAREG